MKAELQKYQNNVTFLRQSEYMEFPMHVHMETFAMCNAACNFCPYPTLERKGEKMPDELIDKIISDLKKIPTNIPFQISPFKVSEPFLDKRLFSTLDKINKELPNAGITLTSNASPITEDALLKLSKVNGIQYLWISFNDHREAEYKKTMQLDYKRTIERLKLIHEFKRQNLLPFMVVLSRVGTGDEFDKEFANWVFTNFPLFEASIFQRGGWLGEINEEFRAKLEVPNVGCARWFEISITASGIVAHCCMDGKAKFPIGDVRKNSVLEIYNAPEYKNLRQKTRTRLDASPCNTCTFM